jgi:micrococcal nuclease
MGTPADPLPEAATTEARVVRVTDGDTIVVELGGADYRVRYIGMDTPESVKPGTPVEKMALEASAANKALVEGKTVLLEKDVSETDRYGRLLRDVWVMREGRLMLVGLELVRTGFAQVSTYPPDVRYVDRLLEAQAAARMAAVGLWSDAAGATQDPTASRMPSIPIVGDAGCHSSYSPCLPIVADLDCPDVRGLGKAPVTIKGPDVYRLDRDGDGLGCE